MKVTRWEEKLFNVLVDPIKESIDERKIESKLNYYYQRLDTQDLVVAGRIGDVESNYQLLADLGMQALLTLYYRHNYSVSGVNKHIPITNMFTIKSSNRIWQRIGR